MKAAKTLILTAVMGVLAVVPAWGAVKSEAYNKLEANIVETEPAKEGVDYYVAVDENGNDWHGIFDDKGNVIALAAAVYDRGEAEDIAEELGERLYYKVPMEYREGKDFYQVIVPVYEDTYIDVLCARPLNLYEDGYKAVQAWNMPNEGDIIVLRTNLTPSYMVRLTVDDNEGFLRWDEHWYPEEGNEEWNKNMIIPLP